MTLPKKICTKCLIEKPLKAFSVNRRNGKDGRQYRCKACYADYRAENRDKILAKKSEHYAANRHAILEQRRAYYAANRDAILGQQAADYLKTPAGKETARRARIKRRHKLTVVDVSFTAQEHEELLRLYDGRCYICRIAPATSLDHVVPVSKGGAHTAANLRPCCTADNSSKGAKDVLDWLEPRWRPVWSAPLVTNYEVSDRHRADLAQILERI